jgi:copper chaperone CopZ
MKIVWIALASLSLVAVSGCAGTEGAYEENAVVHTVSAEEKAATQSTSPIKADSAVLYVNGLGCPLCATNIDKQLLRVDGVETATVNLGDGTVVITLAGKARPSPYDLSESVLDAGFTLMKIETR